MLGFLIIVLAIGGAIGGTILLSADEQTYTVEKYNLVTDVTGLFETDESPQYYDYDLSQNYTGYFTDATIVNGVNYWGGATFTPAGINNYPVKYQPENVVDDSETIDETMNSALDSYWNSYTRVDYYDEDYDNHWVYQIQTYTKTITSLIRELDLNDYDIIEIKGITGWEHEDYTYWSYFGFVDQFQSTTPPSVSYVNKANFSTYPQDGTYSIACNSIKIDTVSNTVSFYYDGTTNNNSFVTSSSLDNAVITYFTAAVLPDDTGIPLDVVAYDINQYEYMDISKGVMVTGVTE